MSAVRLPPAWRGPVRMTLGGMLAFAIADAAGLPEAMWSVMTALIVMRAPPGRSLHAGRDRLLGTLLGAALALALVSLRAWRVPDVVLVGLVLAATSGFVAWRPMLGAAPIAAVIVISSAGSGHDALHVAILRVVEITIGSLVGYAATRVLPRGPLPRPSRPAQSAAADAGTAGPSSGGSGAILPTMNR